MRWRAAVVVAGIGAALVSVAVPASAGPGERSGSFGGFSKDGSHYLSGVDRICAPVPVRAGHASGVASCRRASAREVAAGGFRRGRQAENLSARASGQAVVIRRRASGRPLVIWDAGAVVSRVGAVYASHSGRQVAVEYESRFAGRVTRSVIGFALPGVTAAAPAGAADGSAPGPQAPTAAPPQLTRAEKSSLVRDLHRSKRFARRRAFSRAIAAARAALAIDPAHPEAKFRLAVALAGAGNSAAAIAALSALAHSGRPKAPVWLVVARTARAFAKLRANPAFRRAVGIDPDPTRPRTAYERLVGLGGRWEQAGTPCQRPRVDLHLRARPQTFSLSVRSRCAGQLDRNRFAGHWMWEGHSKLMLVFPNQSGKDEELTCPVKRCADGSGEDCVSCRPARDLQFTLRVVRRRHH